MLRTIAITKLSIRSWSGSRCGSAGNLLQRPRINTNSLVSRRNLSMIKFRDTYESRNKILWGIMGANGVVFGLWFLSDNDRRLRYFLNKYFTISSYGFLQQHLYLNALTSMFSHKDLMHFLVNMFVFHSFGGNVIHTVGTLKFLLIYFGGGVVSSLCQVLWPYVVPNSWPAKRSANPFTPSLGASGGVNALLSWSIMIAPRAMIYFYGVLPIPAALFGIAFVGIDAYGLYFGDSGYGNAGHLGGAAFGIASCLLLKRTIFRRF